MRFRPFLVLSLAVAASGPAAASSLFIDFENPPYTLGVIDLQDGWSSFGAAGMGCAVYDHEVDVNSSTVAAFGAQSLRMSNAVTSGCFGDQTFSKSLPDAAGEAGADGGTYSSPPAGTRFEAEWSFISTVPGAEQPGLSVVASPDRGDGARMSWVQMRDTPTGVEVNFYDYQDKPPYGTSIGDPNGCDGDDNFFFTPVAVGLDRTVPHTVRVVMEFFDGPRNDSVQVWVDGVLLHTGTSWEDYFRYCEGNPTRTVDSILYRTGGSAAPATLGKGWLIDNLSLASGIVTVPIDLRPGTTSNQINTGARQLVPIAILSQPGFAPALDVDITGVFVRGAEPISTKSDVSDLNGDGIDDLTLYFRARDMEPPTAAECNDPDAEILLQGQGLLGSAFEGTDHVTWLGCK